MRVKTVTDVRRVNQLIRDGWDIMRTESLNGKTEFIMVKDEMPQQEIRASRRDGN